MKSITIKKWIMILPLLSAFLWVGCEDLDFPDPNNPTDDTATIQSLVTGAEAGLRTSMGIYLRDMLVVGREAYYLEPADPRYTNELMKGPVDPGGFLTMSPWNANYKVIQNSLILAESGDKGASGVGKSFHAYALWRILSMTDENGARLNYDGDINASVASKSEVLAEIASLLDAGNSDLSGAGDAFSFSLSSGFSGFDTPAAFAKFNQALRARVAVNQDDWSAATTALGNSFIDESGDMSMGAYHEFSSNSNDQDNGMFEDASNDFIKLMVHPSYATDAEDGDGRYAANVSVRDTSLAVITYDGLTSNLAPTIWTSSYDPVPIIRNEELLLLRAEVAIGNGDFASAEADMNIVRAAAGLAGYSDTDASNALDRVLHEKRYSLFFEGQRLIDMRHYGKTGDLPLDRDGDAIVTFPIPETEIPG
ncbi:MAG: RagB/SusD family nutrient uptake outer membrane protein [Candidatus Marinimicrobia bacterium]|jgi:hypothetical protein|nr:RagB/SusD family nutrient uptake outer membrane protein [Candidatus Neomarinimicrobiota bacterium]MBT3501620.1 RagB/SusD family nutrient uptake outer membrane protein [Candidatus Neomarinimicrobiota bacterium]MBT3838346.1 RagB/SusD family nutrient uptake outer membrane protein [Candidatus Neomarinimicrobiota bacterium]MBT4000128.1 RagB/SusD family nutrient uptake outer membrane protein [Candidatus Neomarinimicrobiota bacterium]MBT4281676.1 RagB/SusD family nutrient uptake outer membrane prot